MKAAAVLLALATFLVPAVTAQSSTTGDAAKYPLEATFGPGGDIRMDLCSSGVLIQGTDSDKLRVSFSRAEGKNVKIQSKVANKHADLEISNCPRNNFQVTIEIPKHTDLYVRMWAGQLEIQRITGNKDLQLHAGQLDVGIDKPEEYGQVDGSVNTGQLDAVAFNVSKGGLFRSFHHAGSGKYRLHAHVGAGQLDLN